MLKLTTEAKGFLAKVEDKVEIVLRRHSEQVTDFVDPYLKKCALDFLKTQPGINYKSFGGVDNAERQRIVLCQDYLVPELAMAQICLAKFQGNLDYINCSHRDFLGALLGQGIKREKVGDLFPIEDGFVVVLSRDLAQFMVSDSLKVKGVSLKAQIMEPGEWNPAVQSEKVINTTVSSLRLDTIVAHGFGISRGKVTSFITGGKVKVNWQPILENDYQCKEKDVISLRGKGRIKLAKISGETKKGRLKVAINRYE
ncbi:MAG: RNA-binding protein [Peptococcales bacterium]|jgi:RNA-binding protein YlmH